MKESTKVAVTKSISNNEGCKMTTEVIQGIADRFPGEYSTPEEYEYFCQEIINLWQE